MRRNSSLHPPLSRRWTGVQVAASLAIACSFAQAQSDLDTTPGLLAARAWLAYIDAGRFATSWEEAHPLLQGAFPKAQWETGLVRARAPLGVAVTRKIRLASCTRGTEADPEAEICNVQYDTQFENRPLTDERVTAIRGRDGAWRVAAYSLR